MHSFPDLKANYERFVARVRASNTVWGLEDEEGWAVCPSNEYECDVYVFWSDEADALQHCTEDWAGYEPASIELESFLEHWLPGMERDGYLVGVQFNAELAGLEIEPGDLARDLSE
jgi:Protein of unknown function (DUF2750)